MIKRIENWLRNIFADEIETGLVALEGRISVEIRKGLAVIENKMAQQVAEAVSQTTTNLAEAVAGIQRSIDAELKKTKNTIDQELNHYHATQEQRTADDLLRHPR